MNLGIYLLVNVKNFLFAQSMLVVVFFSNGLYKLVGLSCRHFWTTQISHAQMFAEHGCLHQEIIGRRFDAVPRQQFPEILVIHLWSSLRGTKRQRIVIQRHESVNRSHLVHFQLDSARSKDATTEKEAENQWLVAEFRSRSVSTTKCSQVTRDPSFTLFLENSKIPNVVVYKTRKSILTKSRGAFSSRASQQKPIRAAQMTQ